MDVSTCNDCVHRTVLPNPQTRELTSYCTRHPPTVFGVAAPNGIALVTTYPPVSMDNASCGEWEREEEPFNTEEPFRRGPAII